MQEKLLTVKEVAEILRVGKTTIYKYVADGTIKTIRIGPKCLRIRQSDLADFLEENEANH